MIGCTFYFRYYSVKMFAKAKPSNSLANTRYKFQSQIGNCSFNTASGLLRKTGSQLRQTKLCLNNAEKKLTYTGFVDEEEYMPPPKKQSSRKLSQTLYVATKENVAVAEVPLLKKRGRNLISLIGRVDFCLKMHKMQPDLNAIWNVYGKIVRIVEGKWTERILLLRNDGQGPILQSVFYDFDIEDQVKTLTNGCFVRIVGRFIGQNRMHTFQVEQVSNNVWQQNFLRLESLTSYILMQNTSNIQN